MSCFFVIFCFIYAWPSLPSKGLTQAIIVLYRLPIWASFHPIFFTTLSLAIAIACIHRQNCNSFCFFFIDLALDVLSWDSRSGPKERWRPPVEVFDEISLNNFHFLWIWFWFLSVQCIFNKVILEWLVSNHKSTLIYFIFYLFTFLLQCIGPFVLSLCFIIFARPGIACNTNTWWIHPFSSIVTKKRFLGTFIEVICKFLLIVKRMK